MKKLTLRLKNINEARATIDDEYNKNWSSIPRDVFDRIILLDPQTNLERESIGPSAKQLLLPKYQGGETTFLDDADRVKNALTTFITNRANYEIKNIALYPSVADFVAHIEDPEGHPVTAAAAAPAEGSKLDNIYKTYYSDIPRDKFDQIIALDPRTNVEKGSIGEIAKNLLLNTYKKDKSFLDNESNFEKLIKAIQVYYEKFNTMDQELRNLTSYESIEDFVEKMTKPARSALVNYVLSHTTSSDVRYVGSTYKYDIFDVRSVYGAAIVAGASLDQGGPGANSSSGSSSYSRNRYGHWCTTSSGSFSSYTRNNVRLYDFMARGNNLTADNRAHNYQFAVSPDGTVTSAADGVEDFTHPEDMRIRLFKKENTGADIDDLIEILSNETYNGKPGYTALMREVVQATVSRKLAVPFTYSGVKDLLEFEAKIESYSSDASKAKEIRKEAISRIPSLTIAEGVTEIPFGAFENWSSIKEVHFPVSVKYIGAQSFKGCINLARISFGVSTDPEEGIEKIGARAFANCSALDHHAIYIPNSLQELGRQAFHGTKPRLLILSDRSENSLYVAPEDRQWFADCAEFIELKENFDYTNIDEELLDEKIPRDLASIYRDSRVSTSVSGSHRNHDLDRKNQFSTRRNSPMDYAGATYEEITAAEAQRRITRNPADAEKVRALYVNGNGVNDYLELELRNNGKVYPVHIPEGNGERVYEGNKWQPLSGIGKIDANGNVSTTEYYSIDRIRHMVQSFAGLYTVLNSAYKIYWTNEYEASQDNAFVSKKNNRAANSTTTPAVARRPEEADRELGITPEDPNTWLSDTAKYSWITKAFEFNKEDGEVTSGRVFVPKKLTQTSYKVFDTGNHGKDITSPMSKNRGVGSAQDLSELFDEIFDARRKAKKAYIEKLKIYKTLQKNVDLYDEKEFADEEAIIKQQLEHAYDEYMQANIKLQQIKKRFVTYQDARLEKQQQLLAYYLHGILQLKELIERNEKRLRDLSNQYKDLLDTDIRDSEKMKAGLAKVADAEKEASDAQKKLQELKTKHNEIEEQIKRLMDDLKANAADQENWEAEATKRADKVSQMQAGLAKEAEAAAIDLANQLDSINKGIEDLKKFFVDRGLKQFSPQKHKELNPNIEPLLKKEPEKTEEESAEEEAAEEESTSDKDNDNYKGNGLVEFESGFWYVMAGDWGEGLRLCGNSSGCGDWGNDSPVAFYHLSEARNWVEDHFDDDDTIVFCKCSVNASEDFVNNHPADEWDMLLEQAVGYWVLSEDGTLVPENYY